MQWQKYYGRSNANSLVLGRNYSKENEVDRRVPLRKLVLGEEQNIVTPTPDEEGDRAFGPQRAYLKAVLILGWVGRSRSHHSVAQKLINVYLDYTKMRCINENL